ncbi:hypothetical protein R5R35_002813 [Gryllus longicercus]|uniref:Uncharacterized protein n=1 Tax=Gryllus longicercus TaxID=2509291 RepID=A0AAN9W2B0_9ORTH
MLRSLLLCSLVALAAAAAAASEDNSLDEPHTNTVDRTSSTVSAIQLPGDFSLSNNFVSGLVTAGAVVLGVLGVAAVLAILLPLFGVKLCYLTGTCDPLGPQGVFVASQPLPAAPAGSPHAYDAYNAAAYNNAASAGYPSTSYQRSLNSRSLEYVGPILKALSTAYDKYAAPRLLRKGGRATASAAPAPPAAALGPAPTAAPEVAAARRRRR